MFKSVAKLGDGAEWTCSLLRLTDGDLFSHTQGMWIEAVCGQGR